MNVTALAEDDGDVLERYLYDPYGNCTVYNSDWSQTVSWANSKKNNIRFCGYYFDSETGLYHVRNRMYHAKLGLWLIRDPEGYVNGMSLYEYVGGRPTGATDPDGLRILWQGKAKDVQRAKKRWQQARNRAKGPMKAKMDAIEKSSKTVRMKVVSGKQGARIIVGGFESGKLDIDDVEAFPDTGPATKASKTAHEVVEQWQKQRVQGKKKNYLDAHAHGVAAEDAVSGWKRGPKKTERRGRLPGGRFKVELLYGRESPDPAKPGHKRKEYRKVTYEIDAKGKVMNVKVQRYVPPTKAKNDGLLQ